MQAPLQLLDTLDYPEIIFSGFALSKFPVSIKSFGPITGRRNISVPQKEMEFNIEIFQLLKCFQVIFKAVKLVCSQRLFSSEKLNIMLSHRIVFHMANSENLHLARSEHLRANIRVLTFRDRSLFGTKHTGRVRLFGRFGRVDTGFREGHHPAKVDGQVHSVFEWGLLRSRPRSFLPEAFFYRPRIHRFDLCP